jgi:iron complex outermembrane receptor protein
MINTVHARLAGGVSSLALVLALGGVAHAGEAMATAAGPPAPAAEAAPRPRPRTPRPTTR